MHRRIAIGVVHNADKDTNDMRDDTVIDVLHTVTNLPERAPEEMTIKDSNSQACENTHHPEKH